MTHKKDQPELDARAAGDAFQALEAELRAIPADQVLARNIDRKRAALLAWRAARELKGHDIRKRLTSLPKTEFDSAQIAKLEPAALAVWHAAVEAESAAVQTSGARLPTRLVEAASAVKQRMLRLVQYHFSDDPADGAEIADIISGTGYLDLATDLERLAKLYDKHASEVKQDPKYYVAGDAREARLLAQQILKALGDEQSVDAAQWADLDARALTYLTQMYDDISLTVQWLQRNDTSGPIFEMPLLQTTVRRARGTRRSSEDTTEPEPPDPTPQPPGPPVPAH